MKVIAAGTGYNDLFVTLGVFSSKEKAEEAFVAAGCVKVAKPKIRYEGGKRIDTGEFHPERIYTTQAFADWMHEHKLSCYSTGASFAEGWMIALQEIELDTVALGYNDD